jgi:hypothetical protein
LFNQRKNKRFSYKPRFKDPSSDNRRQETKEDFETKWKEVNGVTKRKRNVFTSLPALILMLVSLVVLIYILDGYI